MNETKPDAKKTQNVNLRIETELFDRMQKIVANHEAKGERIYWSDIVNELLRKHLHELEDSKKSRDPHG